MRIPIRLDIIDRAEALRYLGWRGECNDACVLEQIEHAEQIALRSIEPAALVKRFSLTKDNCFGGTGFTPAGKDIARTLNGCCAAYMMAATLGAQSERLLLKEQVKSPARAMFLDAVLSAAIEQVCDRVSCMIEQELDRDGLYPTRRFSPGYGDMPIGQSADICAVLGTDKQLGLCVSSSGLMIPRKSVTAIIGISNRKCKDVLHRCSECSMKAKCFVQRCGE